MADNEERIYIGIINPKGDFCPVPAGCCNSFCDCCNGGLTRQEAIEVMAKAIYVHFVENSVAIGLAADWEDLKQPLVKKFYIETAEAALNVLLEGGK